MDWKCRTVTPREPGFQEMARVARAEGFGFIDRLVREWAEGSNRFDGPGECLLGVFEGETLLAVGGLNRDPYASARTIGRIRHLYVRPTLRRAGLATTLMQELLARSAPWFDLLRLRTDNPAARQLYEKLGFQPVNEPEATHVWLASRRAGS
jgi:GNAT superfamily N-acetyltransferase